MFNFDVLPRVKECKCESKSKFTIDLNTRINVEYDSNENDFVIINQAATILADAISKQLFLRPQIVFNKYKSNLYLPYDHKNITLKVDARSFADFDNDEVYSLEIDDKKILLQGKNEIALIYAVQTLIQLIERNSLKLNGLKILDYPCFKRRGFYHDVTRGRIPKLSFLKRLVQIMSKYKLNELQLYIEHSYLFVEESEVWRDDTPLTAEEIIELDDYCYRYGIELVPSISSFGHLEKLLQTRKFHKHCELNVDLDRPFTYVGRMSHHTVNVSDGEIFDYICRRIDEFSSLCRSKKFNICGDETFDLCSEKNKDLADKLGKTRVYIDFIKKLNKHLKNNGLTMQFWGDVIASQPELASELSEDTICLVWDYSSEPKAVGTEVLAKIGVKQYLCPGTCGWNCKLQYNRGAYLNNLGMTKFASKNSALGLLNTNWGDFANLNDPYLSIPGLIYGALFTWSSENISNQLDYESLNKEISMYQLMDSSGQLLKLADEISDYDVFNWYNMVHIADLSKTICDADKLYDEQKKVLKNLYSKIENVDIDEIIASIREKKDNLYSLIGATACSDKVKENLPYAIGAENILISMQLYKCLLKIYDIKEVVISLNDFSNIAEKIEYFLRGYESYWKYDSKQSELASLKNIYFYYCNLLRDYYNSNLDKQIIN